MQVRNEGAGAPHLKPGGGRFHSRGGPRHDAPCAPHVPTSLLGSRTGGREGIFSPLRRARDPSYATPRRDGSHPPREAGPTGKRDMGLNEPGRPIKGPRVRRPAQSNGSDGRSGQNTEQGGETRWARVAASTQAPRSASGILNHVRVLTKPTRRIPPKGGIEPPGPIEWPRRVGVGGREFLGSAARRSKRIPPDGVKWLHSNSNRKPVCSSPSTIFRPPG